MCLAPCFLSRSITFLVNQSFGVCCLLARFRCAKYSNAAVKGGGLAAEAFSCKRLTGPELLLHLIRCKVGGPTASSVPCLETMQVPLPQTPEGLCRKHQTHALDPLASAALPWLPPAGMGLPSWLVSGLFPGHYRRRARYTYTSVLVKSSPNAVRTFLF